jgi:hypothetical protein
MSDHTPPQTVSKLPPKRQRQTDSPSGRESRLKTALKANIARRKAQALARSDKADTNTTED